MSFTEPNIITTQDYFGSYGNPFGPAGFNMLGEVKVSETVAASNAGLTGGTPQPAMAWVGLLILLIALRLIWEWSM